MESDVAAARDLALLGHAIRSARLEAGLSQEGLALAASLDRSYVGAVERGERNISFLNLLKLARALNVDVAIFFRHISGFASQSSSKKANL